MFHRSFKFRSITGNLSNFSVKAGHFFLGPLCPDVTLGTRRKLWPSKAVGLMCLACTATVLAGCAVILEIFLPPKFTPQGQIWIDGLEADATGDFAGSLARFNALANAGDPYAAWVLGKFYQGGRGVSQDQAQAERWYREAAARGYVQAEYHLSLIEKKGWPEFHSQEVKWLKEDAEAGIVEAQHALGTYHRSGRGVKLSASEAAKWWKLSARRGYATSQARLALLYSKGDGVPRDGARAYAWMNLAAANLLPSAVKDIAIGLRDNWGVKLSSDQLSRAEELAMAFEKTAEGAPKLALARGAEVMASEAPKPAKEKAAETAAIAVPQPATEKAAEVMASETPKPATGRVTELAAAPAPKPATGKTTGVTTSEATKPPTGKEAALTTGKATSRPADKAAGEAVVSAIPPPRDQFFLHLASHRTQGDAAREWELLTRKFAALLGTLQPIIRSVDLGDRGVFYRIQAGPIGSRASARALCRQLKARDQYCRVFRRR